MDLVRTMQMDLRNIMGRWFNGENISVYVGTSLSIFRDLRHFVFQLSLFINDADLDSCMKANAIARFSNVEIHKLYVYL